jgi:hypothetical protein
LADVAFDVAQNEVCTAPTAQAGKSLFDVDGVRDLRAAIHRDLGRCAELTLELADNEKTHIRIPS